MPSKPPVLTVASQWLAGAWTCAVAALVITGFHPSPKDAAWSGGLPLWQQLVVASALIAFEVAQDALVLAMPSPAAGCSASHAHVGLLAAVLGHADHDVAYLICYRILGSRRGSVAAA